jgi:tetratricopeptide (TPR) repeat protein
VHEQPVFSGGRVYSIRFFGIIWFSALMYGQISDTQGMGGPDEIRQPGPDRSRARPFPDPLLTASGETPILEEATERLTNKPISGVVTLHELEHPIAKKALREASEAQRFVRDNNVPKAIAKFEQAIRIDPAYRDAHCNLGVLYARAGRGAEARAEFQKALNIGPPIAPIYADLALVSAALGQFQEAELSARKALELDPASSVAKVVLKRLPAH